MSNVFIPLSGSGGTKTVSFFVTHFTLWNLILMDWQLFSLNIKSIHDNNFPVSLQFFVSIFSGIFLWNRHFPRTLHLVLLLIYLKSTVTLVKTEEDRFGSVFLYLVSDPLIQTPKHLCKLILQVWRWVWEFQIFLCRWWKVLRPGSWRHRSLHLCGVLQ